MGFLRNLFNKQPKPGQPQPVTDETFEQEVLANDLPSAVDFWSRTCPPCHVMGGLLEEIGPDYVGKVNIFKLNVDENPETAQLYQIRGIPTLILIRNGREVDRIVGLLPLNPLREKLDQLTRGK
jgi:thioredoxin 1